jgi:uncharacterized protein (TIGR02246 family)
MRKTPLVLICAAAFFLGACGSEPADKAAIEKSIKSVEATMLKAISAKDAKGGAANYAEDAIFMSPMEPAVKGRDGVENAFKTLFADPALKLDFSADRVEVADSGDLAVSHGTYTMTLTDPMSKQPINDKGNYVTAYRKQSDGSWKAVFDINTSQVAPPPPPEPKAAAKKTGKKKR